MSGGSSDLRLVAWAVRRWHLGYWHFLLAAEREWLRFRRKCWREDSCQEFRYRSYDGKDRRSPAAMESCWCKRHPWTPGIVGRLLEVRL